MIALPGAPNDGLLLHQVKTLFRLSRELLDLQNCIKRGRAIWVCSKLLGFQYYFPENFRCNLTFYESENFSNSSPHRIFESENFRFPFYYEK